VTTLTRGSSISIPSSNGARSWRCTAATPEPGRTWESVKDNADLTIRFDEVRELGDRVLALGEMHAKGHTTRLDLAGEIAQLATFRDGKVVEFRDFRSHAEALEAAGLSE
jgi:ketosteroid isomerase-like protein